IRPLVLVAVLALPLGALALGWREGRRPERADDGRPPVPVAAHDSRALTEEAIRLYAAGQFPRACERFSRAAAAHPASAAPRAIAHLNAVLEREPGNAGALRLLEKVERERRAESGFHRDVTPRFVLKYRSTPGAEARRTILRLLEVAAERVGRTLRWEPRERLTVVLYERGQF